MTSLYPQSEPHDQGLLDVGDGNRIHWQVFGNPVGYPALYVHGGPGSGSSVSASRYFDPAVYRIILLDQRNCGQSLPHAGAFGNDLTDNTTWHLVEDMERLRRHLNVEQWLLFGTSWGSTLALAYAETHPKRVSAMILAGVTTTRPQEIDWLTRGMAILFPEEWNRMLAALPPELRVLGPLEGYHRLLNAPDMATRLKAARDWHDWEAASILLADPDGMPRRWSDPHYLLARARIITHYFRHNAWLEDGALLRDAHKLAGIPGMLIQGRLDLEAPLTTAWELSRSWPGSELIVMEKAAHSPYHDEMARAIVAATDRFRKESQK
ncbi:prolyl aminopeptidase [Rhizobium sp. S152]|uniref:prolyl aminopeptidase n=1 Tax=Rhizobium sp. S152 TaxID=3055038 RepID=UPI0025A9E86E|nr:prolyl aminopeptidase [Rhizobium sp. S152]MDM9628113.1 prolyl aminopeptidase [Rhizobium sp. S152]